MSIDAFIAALKSTPDRLQFSETLALIDTHYQFTATRFRNGEQVNERDQNQGSCKLFSFARLHQLSREETLLCFGEYYRSVLASPTGADHQNIRNFMRFGWEGIEFDGQALTAKA